MGKLSDYVYTKAARVGSAIALSAVLVGGLSVAPAFGHDDYGYGQHGGYGNSGDTRRIAAVNGYAEGYEHGIADRNSRQPFEYQHSNEYRDARSGYNRNMGSERDYQNSFRQGYGKGYSDAYYGRSRSSQYGHGSYNTGGGYNGGYGGGYNGGGYNGGSYNGGGYNNGGYNGGYNGGGYQNDPRYSSDRDGDLDRNEVAKRAAQQGYYDGFARGQYDLNNRVRRPNPQGHGAYQNALNGFDPSWGYALTFQQYYRQYFTQGYQAGFGRQTYNKQYNRRWW